MTDRFLAAFLCVFSLLSCNSAYAEYDAFYGDLNVLQKAIVNSSDEEALAVLKQHPDLFDTPIAKFNSRSNTESNYTPLLIALFEGRFKVAHELIRMGANVSFRDVTRGRTPVYMLLDGSAYRRNPLSEYESLLQEMIAAHADIETPDADPYGAFKTPLMAAARYPDGNFVKQLIEAGARVEVASAYNHRAIHDASDIRLCTDGYTETRGETCLKSKIEYTRLLIAAHVDINARQGLELAQGSTALMNFIGLLVYSNASYMAAAAHKYALEGLKLAVAAGANTCHPTIYGTEKSAADYLRRRENSDVHSAEYDEALKILEPLAISQNCLSH
jgi:hypothetical protein